MALALMNNALVHGVKSIFKSAQLPSNLTPYELSKINSEWGNLAVKVSQGVGCVRFSTTLEHICHGPLVGVDRIMVPLHALKGKCMPLLEVSFDGEDDTYCFSDTYKVTRVFGLLGADFAVVQLSRGSDGLFPGCKFPVLRCIGDPSGELMLVHGNQHGERVVTVRNFFPCTDRSGKLCTLSETFFGSSGGPYFTKAGVLVGMHLGKATGTCSNSDQERTFLLLRDIWEKTFLSKISPCQPLPTPTCLPGCIPYVPNLDPCYFEEAKRPCDGKLTLLNGTYVELRLGSIKGIGDDSRGIQFDFQGKTLTYIFTQDPHDFGAYKAQNGPPILYYTAAEVFENSVVTNLKNKQRPFPYAFICKAYGHPFTARLFDYDTQGQRYFVTPNRALAQRVYF